MDKKKIFIACCIFIIIASLSTSIYFIIDNKEANEFTIDGIYLPKNKDILKDTAIENLKITNISIIIRENTSSYKAILKNTSNKDIKINQLMLEFYEDKYSTKAIALVDATIKKDEERHISITTEQDLTNITEIKYILK